MGRRVSVVAVGSPVHPLRQKVSTLDRLIEVIRRAGFEVNIIGNIVSSFNDVLTIQDRILEVSEPLLILHLTGGTSKIALETAKWSNAPITLVAHGKSNSLPSSLEAYNKLKGLGLDVEIRFVNLKNGKLEISYKTMDFEGCMVIFGEVAPRTFDVTCPATLAQRLKVRVKHVSGDELERQVIKHQHRIDVMEEFLSSFKGEVQVARGELQLSLAFKEAISEVIRRAGCNVFTIDCFEVIKRMHVTPCLAVSLLAREGILGICEADIQAAACMISVWRLTHPFMGNITAIDDEEDSVILAHCTAAITLASNESAVKLKSHFETDRSVSVDVPLKLGDSVMISCDPKLREASLVECLVDRSQLEHEGMCRTQVLLKVKSKPSKILSSWPSGHAVLALQVSMQEVKRELIKRGFHVNEL
ncbi:MAG: hypothetical protein N3F04_06835 [Candidatus Nezhaarchaeota archaeon]|nr:hypothetical protein [Candidatus Nezhaarchaeota archaeon]MCX8142457.1 hypothetical protein [Candidatus Nezhaarchaeota archaeon]MDW8050570.1 hypothetical protein [Nitrososphaerota archaeon]